MAAKTAAKKDSKDGAQVPIVGYLKLGKNPFLQANECKECQARFFDRRNACANCGGREFKKARVKSKGTLKAFSIVHRAAPGLPVPYTSAIVDCDGTTVRSNVVNTPADPENISLGMPVKLTTYVVSEDDDGTEAVAFGYEPV